MREPISLHLRARSILEQMVRERKSPQLPPAPALIPSASWCQTRTTRGRVPSMRLFAHQAIRSAILSLQQLAEESLGSTAIPARLNQNVENIAILIDSSPQIHLTSSDPHKHLVQMPEVQVEPAPSTAEAPFPVTHVVCPGRCWRRCGGRRPRQ